MGQNRTEDEAEDEDEGGGVRSSLSLHLDLHLQEGPDGSLQVPMKPDMVMEQAMALRMQ